MSQQTLFPSATRPLVVAEDLSVHFNRGRRAAPLRAVDQASLAIARGETLGLVGESGCGKSTLGRALIGLRQPTTGDIRFDGQPVTGRTGRDLRGLRRRMQMIFQDPYGSLDPRMTVSTIVSEPIRAHRLLRGEALDRRVEELLILVGLDPEMAHRYPHAFSGGQRQRIAIARALAADPEFIVCDEPISALDVSIQAQILNLLVRLRRQMSLTYLFISHDLAVVRRLADRVAVMYLGRIVEIGSRQSVFDSPAHPYTVALLSAVPTADVWSTRHRQRIVLTGDVPSPSSPPPGCPFHTRCWLYEQLGRPERCRREAPRPRAITSVHDVACHHAEQIPEALSRQNPPADGARPTAGTAVAQQPAIGDARR